MEDTDADLLRNWISGVTGPTAIRVIPEESITAVPATPLPRPPPTPTAKSKHASDIRVEESLIKSTLGQAGEEPQTNTETGDADGESDAKLQKPRGRPRPRPAAKKSKPQAANQVVDKGPVASEDEGAERDAALSSPMKGGTARLLSKVRHSCYTQFFAITYFAWLPRSW